MEASLPVPPARPEPLPHMLRRRRHYAHRLLVLRNRNHDLAGMQMQDRLAEARAVAVDIVADNRPARRRRMHAQLMGAAGYRLQREPTQAVAAAAHFPGGDGFLTLRVRLLPPAALGVEPAERHVDGAFILGRSALDHGPIGFSDLAVLEHHAQRRGSLAAAA